MPFRNAPAAHPLSPGLKNAATTRAAWPDFVAVDEGLDRLFRWEAASDAVRWSTALDMKCRTLQRISTERILGVTDHGFFEADLTSGSILRCVRLETGGVIAAARRANGNTFLAGLDLADRNGVTFAEYDPAGRLARAVAFPGDYVRGATLTEADTILFTNDHRVVEGDWSGLILREFAAPGFKHAWKSLRLANDHTIISAGYGAYVVEFNSMSREVRRWQCDASLAFVRPFFFGDFTLLTDGSLVVCNWLGHGSNLGSSGYALIQFDPAGTVFKVWQDGERTSSVQAFVLLDS